jgi:hypothetical protein
MTAEAFLGAFAQAIIARAFGRAEAMLAPWVREALPDGGLRVVVELTLDESPDVTLFTLTPIPTDNPTSMREAAEDVDPDDAGRTLANTDGLGAINGPPSYPIPDALTSKNFRGCWRIEFQPDEEFTDQLDEDIDYSFALYVAVVADGAECAVGYLEPMD